VNHAFVTSTSDYTGGIVAFSNADGPARASVSNSANYGDVTGTFRVGGIYGYGNGVGATNNYNTASIKSSGTNAGGIFGYAGAPIIIVNNYSTGNVEANSIAGGLAGTFSGYSYDDVQIVIVQNNVIIPETIKITGASGVGRIFAGYANGTDFTNVYSNVGWDGANEGAFADNVWNGAGVDAAALYDGTAWPATFKMAPWTFAAGKLPILSTITSPQTDTLPSHLLTLLSDESEFAYLSAPTEISGAVNAEFNAIVRVGSFSLTDAKAIEAVLTIPEAFTVQGITVNPQITGVDFHFNRDGEKLRIAAFSQSGETIDFDYSIFPAQVLSINLKLDQAVETGAQESLTIDSLRLLATSDVEPYAYHLGESAVATITIVPESEPLSVTACVLYAGDDSDLI
jgi:hypothetical protein